MFNPSKYSYRARQIGEEGTDAFLQLEQGAESQIVRFPKVLLPPQTEWEEGLQISVHPPQIKPHDEVKNLKELLQELIN